MAYQTFDRFLSERSKISCDSVLKTVTLESRDDETLILARD